MTVTRSRTPMPKGQRVRPYRPSIAAGITTATAYVLPFPMRADFLAQIIIPRDMTNQEAERLCAFIRAFVSTRNAP